MFNKFTKGFMSILAVMVLSATMPLTAMAEPVIQKAVYDAAGNRAEGRTYKKGEKLLFTISGQHGENGIYIKDTVPDNLAIGNVYYGGEKNGNTVSWHLEGTGEEAPFFVSFDAMVMDEKGGTIQENQANLNNVPIRTASTSDNSITGEGGTVSSPNVQIRPQDGTTGVDLPNGVSVKKGDVISYKISFRNDSAAVKSFVVRDTVPQNTVSETDKSQPGSTVKWTLDVAPGQTESVIFRALVTAETGSIVNFATVTVDGKEFKTDTVTHVIEKEGGNTNPDQPTNNGKINPVLVVQDSSGSSADGYMVKPDSKITYKITVTNPYKEQKTIHIHDDVDTSKLSSIKVNDSGSNSSGDLTWDVTLNANTSKTVSFTAKPKNAKVKTIENVADATLDGVTETSNRVTVSAIKTPTISVTDEQGNDIDGKTVKEGELVTFKISYENTSEEEKDFEIEANIPSGVDFDSAQQKGKKKSNSVKWEIEDVPDGKKGKVTFKAKAKSGNVRCSGKITVDDISVNTDEVSFNVEKTDTQNNANMNNMNANSQVSPSITDNIRIAELSENKIEQDNKPQEQVINSEPVIEVEPAPVSENDIEDDEELDIIAPSGNVPTGDSRNGKVVVAVVMLLMSVIVGVITIRNRLRNRY